MTEEINNDVLELPYLKKLTQLLTSKSSLVIKGNVLENASSFAVNFYTPVTCCFVDKNDGDKDIAFNLSSHFDSRYVIRNSTRKLKWQTDEITSNQAFPLARGSEFSIEIFIAGKDFLVAFNGIHFCTFRLRTSLNSIDSFEVTGDVELRSVYVRHDQTLYPNEKPLEIGLTDKCHVVNFDGDTLNCHELQLPLMCNLSKSLKCGNVIKIEGKLKMLPYSFFINLQNSEIQWPQPSVLLHINGRYNYSQKKNDKNLLVFNSWINNCWGTEKRLSNGCLPIPGSLFELRIICGEDHFKIAIDEVTMNFPYNNVALQTAKVIYIQGDVYVYSITVS